jgi:hypothetical protein
MPLFQQRHYVAIAKTIAEISDNSVRTSTAIRLADLFQKDNPKFKYIVFMRASGVTVNNYAEEYMAQNT